MKKPYTLNTEKMNELIVYISSKNQDSPEFGATVLNKMLYYSDRLAFIYLGRPITGDTYVRRQHGPTPKSLLHRREELVEDGSIEIEKRPRFGHIQERTANLREPNTDVFTEEELEIIDYVIEELMGMTANQISEITHQELVWQLWREGEDIPYEAFFISKHNPLSQEALEWAAGVANESRFPE